MEKIKTGLAAFGMSGQIFHAPFIEYKPSFLPDSNHGAQ